MLIRILWATSSTSSCKQIPWIDNSVLMCGIVKISCRNGNYLPFFRDELLDRFFRIENDDFTDGTRS